MKSNFIVFWERIPKYFKAVAKDSNGQVWAYHDTPRIFKASRTYPEGWEDPASVMIRRLFIDEEFSDPDSCDWRDSLRCREEYAPNEETLKALEELNSLSGGNTFKTVEELFEDLGGGENDGQSINW